MTTFFRAFLVVAIMACLTPAASFAVSPYSQDFEGLDQGSVSALGDDGWLVFANVFNPGGDYLYGYGPFPAPNDGAAFCAIASGEGGPSQGDQQLVVFSDYNNVDHAVGNLIESNVFQEQTIDAEDVGGTWVFAFDAKLGNLADQSTALAFIKTLDPNNGFVTTNFITADMTNTSTTWTGYTLSIFIDESLVGQILQIGFSNTATLYQGSGVFYDNVNFARDDPVATHSVTWGQVKSLYR